jgi:hypothetical protein
MAETVFAVPPPDLWLDSSLHVKPRGKWMEAAALGPGNTGKTDRRRLLRVGEKVKGQTPSRKKPFLVLGPAS